MSWGPPASSQCSRVYTSQRRSPSSAEFAAAMLHAEAALRIAESVSHVYSLAFAYYGIGTVPRHPR